jgi:hypothetical protein
MSNTHQWQYSHATAIYDGDEFIHAVLWGEHDSGEEMHATESYKNGLVRGYVHAKWGKGATLQYPHYGCNVINIAVDGVVVGSIRTVVMDMTDTAQATLCSTLPYRERTEEEYRAWLNPPPKPENGDDW